MTTPPAPAPLRPAVFLDRDGTINEDVGYLSELSHLTIYPWAIDAVRLLNRAGYLVVMVTNQGGIGRRMIRPGFLAELHAVIDARLAAGGAHVDGWYFCPHHPEALIEELRVVCGCRKPAPGLLLDAARDHGIDLDRSWIVGDKWSDIQAGQRTGGRGILVRTGWGVIEEACGRTGRRSRRSATPSPAPSPASSVPMPAGPRRPPARAAEVVCSVRMATAAAPPGVSARRLLDLIAAARGKRVVVLGDLIADEFVSGRISRVSREAPVLILEYDKTEIVPGGAGNAAHNVATLGGGGDARGAGRPRRTGPARAGVVPLARRSSGHRPPRRVSHAGEDPDPRRRRAFGQTAGRARGPLHARADDRGVARAVDAGRAEGPASRRRGARLRLRLGPALAAGRHRSRRAARRAPRAGARRLALRPPALPRPHRLHAERVGSGARARCHDRRCAAGCSSGPAAPF